MSRAIFGWSYPPGAAGDPFAPYNQEDGPCEVCGSAVDDCICPECPTCQSHGDPSCYVVHGLTRNPAQIAGRAGLDELERQEASRCADEAAYWSDPQRKVEDTKMDEYWRDLDAHESKRPDCERCMGPGYSGPCICA